MPNFTYTTDIPFADNDPSVDQPDMKVNTNSTNSILAVDHYSFNDNNGGYHQKATFVEQSSDPAAVANTAIVYSKDDGSGNTNLFVRRNSPALILSLTAIKAWGVFNGSTGALTAGYNCTTARNSAGNYSVTFTVNLPNANYAVVSTGQMTSAFTTGGIIGVGNLAASGFNIYARSLTAASGTDLTPMSFIVIG